MVASQHIPNSRRSRLRRWCRQSHRQPIKWFHLHRYWTAPSAPDTHTVSSALNTNYGGSTTLKLGASSSGDHEIFIEFDLSQMPWPSAMTPTSTMLRLYRTQVAGVSPLTVSAHACSTFTESGVTALQSPACSVTEITRSTLSVTPPSGWLEWDITSLAQSNIANGNQTMTIQLKAVGSGRASIPLLQANTQRSLCAQHYGLTMSTTLLVLYLLLNLFCFLRLMVLCSMTPQTISSKVWISQF